MDLSKNKVSCCSAVICGHLRIDFVIWYKDRKINWEIWKIMVLLSPWCHKWVFLFVSVTMTSAKKKGRKIDNIRNIYAEFPILKICWIFNVLLLILLIHQVVSYQMLIGVMSWFKICWILFFIFIFLRILDLLCWLSILPAHFRQWLYPWWNECEGAKWIYTFPTMDFIGIFNNNTFFICHFFWL